MNNSEYRAHLYLKGIGYAADQVEKLRDEIQYMQDLTQEKDLTADRVQSSGIGNPTEQTALKVIALREKLTMRIDQLLDYRMEAFRIMDMARLTREEDQIIRHYYLFTGSRGPTWERIAEDLDYSVRAVYTIRTRALRKIAKVLDELDEESVHCIAVIK